METGLFDLQSEIKNYFKRLHIKGNLTKSDETELESHIYDGVDFLKKKGLSTEEAFLIIIKRMGTIDMLSEEYNKVNTFSASEKMRLYFITGLGILLSLGTIFLFVYELISLYRKAYLSQTTADTLIRSLLYFGLCISVLIVIKWGKSFSVFLQKSIDRKPLSTALILFLIPLLNFLLQPVLIRFFDKRGQEEKFNYRLFDIGDIQFINLSFYLLVISVLLLTLVSFWSFTKMEQQDEKRVFFELPIVFLFIFSIVISIAAAMTRYIPESNSGLQNSVFLAIVYAIGSFSIAFYNNHKLWLKLFIFCAFGLGLGNLLVN
jgi:hypothetical protein